MTLALSSRAKQVLAIFVQAAERNERAPSNLYITEQLGLTCEKAVTRFVTELSRAGLIEVRFSNQYRTIKIIATGKTTLPDPRSKKNIEKQVRREFVEIPVRRKTVIDREPCRKCGVRADIGCRHKPKAESWEIEL